MRWIAAPQQKNSLLKLDAIEGFLNFTYSKIAYCLVIDGFICELM